MQKLILNIHLHNKLIFYNINISLYTDNIYRTNMNERPIKGNKAGKYTFVLDPTNDICAYYNG